MKTMWIAGAVALALFVAVPGVEAGPIAEPQEPNCYSIYNQWNAGPVVVTQYSSCSYGVQAGDVYVRV